MLLSPFTIAAKLAIVIDDLGYNSMPVALSALPSQISLSILPDTPFDIATAELAHQQQRDVLLHMPMQPQGAAPLEPLTLTNQCPKRRSNKPCATLYCGFHMPLPSITIWAVH